MHIDMIGDRVVNVCPPTPIKGYTFYFSYNSESWIKREVEQDSLEEVRVLRRKILTNNEIKECQVVS